MTKPCNFAVNSFFHSRTMSSTEYKLQAVWSIKKDTFLNKEFAESQKFVTTLPNVQYSITLCPNDDNKGYTAISFVTSQSVSIKEMKLFIPSAKFEGNLNTVVVNPGAECPTWNTVFIKYDDILNFENGFFVNDILTMEIRGILCYDETPIFDLGRFLWYKDDNKDFAIVVENIIIMAHRFILQQFSSILAADTEKDELEIENFDVKIVEAVIELCYGLDRSFFFLNCPNVSKIDCLLKMLEFTCIYDMPAIKEQIEHKLREFITAENVAELANKSLEFNAKILGSFCLNFLSDCIKNGKPFNGTLTSLKLEIIAEVFKNSFCHTQLS